MSRDESRGVQTPLSATSAPCAAGVDARLARLVALLEAGQALALRKARLLAWFALQDLAPLGYSSFSAFLREEVPGADSWLRALIRLAESPLDLVKGAVWVGALSLTDAVRVVGHLHPMEQVRWLADPYRAVPRRDGGEPRANWRLLAGHDLVVVHRARSLARSCLGVKVSDTTADAYILGCWREGLGGDRILEDAREPPAPPGPDCSAWPAMADPADLLAGPWEAPAGLAAARTTLRQLLALEEERTLEAGHAYRAMVRERWYRELGAASAEDLVAARCPCTVRTLQRYARLASAAGIPAVAAAVARGLPLARAARIVETVPPTEVPEWLRLAPRLGALELERALAFAGRPDLEGPVRAAYSAAAAGEATGNISLRSVQEPPAPRGMERVHPDLPQAARWFLRTVRPEPQKGFGRVKERDRFTCQNPECGRQTLRVEAHHIVFRSEGGADTAENGITVCRACHLRLIHPGRVRVRAREGGAVVWTWPDREVVLC